MELKNAIVKGWTTEIRDLLLGAYGATFVLYGLWHSLVDGVTVFAVLMMAGGSIVLSGVFYSRVFLKTTERELTGFDVLIVVGVLLVLLSVVYGLLL